MGYLITRGERAVLGRKRTSSGRGRRGGSRRSGRRADCEHFLGRCDVCTSAVSCGLQVSWTGDTGTHSFFFIFTVLRVAHAVVIGGDVTEPLRDALGALQERLLVAAGVSARSVDDLGDLADLVRGLVVAVGDFGVFLLELLLLLYLAMP